MKIQKKRREKKVVSKIKLDDDVEKKGKLVD